MTTRVQIRFCYFFVIGLAVGCGTNSSPSENEDTVTGTLVDSEEGTRKDSDTEGTLENTDNPDNPTENESDTAHETDSDFSTEIQSSDSDQETGTGETETAASTDESCSEKEHKGCVEGSLYWFDSCGNQEDLIEVCEGEQVTCRDDMGGEASCACTGYWSGENCDICDIHDPNQNCEACVPGRAGPDCQDSCIVFVDDNAPSGGDGKTWATALKSIHDAIEVAAALVEKNNNEPCAVFVAEGKYYTKTSDTAVEWSLTMRPKVHLIGGFSGNESTILERTDVSAHPTYLGNDPKVFSREDGVIVYGASSTILDGFVFESGVKGAVVSNSVKNMLVVNCEFRNNESDTDGAAMLITDSSLMLIDTRFESNEAKGSGGAIYTENSQIKIVNSEFLDNQARKSGGAIHCLESSLEIVNGRFVRNAARIGEPQLRTMGGAIALIDSEKVNITGVRFVNNLANKGGGIYREQGVLHGLSASEAELNVRESYFASQCYGKTSGYDGYVGADIYAKGVGGVLLKDTYFFKPNANEGGAVYLVGEPDMTLGVDGSRFVFSPNSVCTRGTVEGDIRNSIFMGSESEGGGYSPYMKTIDIGVGSRINISNAIFFNTGKPVAGEVCGLKEDCYEVNIRSSLIARSGELDMTMAEHRITNTIFYESEGYKFREENIHYSIIEDPRIKNDTVIDEIPRFLDTGMDMVEVKGCKRDDEDGMLIKCFYEGDSLEPGCLNDSFVELMPFFFGESYWGYVVSNTSETITFLGELKSPYCRLWDFRPSLGSPAVDAGYGNIGPETDFDGNPRVDIPGVENTGYGDVDFYDIGPYEAQ